MDIHYIVHCNCLSLKKNNLNPKNHLMKENALLWITPGLMIEDCWEEQTRAPGKSWNAKTVAESREEEKKVTVSSISPPCKCSQVGVLTKIIPKWGLSQRGKHCTRSVPKPQTQRISSPASLMPSPQSPEAAIHSANRNLHLEWEDTPICRNNHVSSNISRN